MSNKKEVLSNCVGTVCVCYVCGYIEQIILIKATKKSLTIQDVSMTDMWILAISNSIVCSDHLYRKFELIYFIACVVYNVLDFYCLNDIGFLQQVLVSVRTSSLFSSLIPTSLALGRVAASTCSSSSFSKRLGTSPEFSMLLISSKNSSTTIYKRKKGSWLYIFRNVQKEKNRHPPPSYLSIRKEEHHIFSLHTSHLVESSQVLMKAVIVVASAQFNLEAPVSTHVGCQPSEWLFACTSHSH